MRGRLREIGPILVAALLAGDQARADDTCGLEDPSVALEAPPVPRKPGELTWSADDGAVVRRVRPGPRNGVGHGAAGGALAGKTVYVSAGHGWTWRPNLGAWRTQRGNTHDLVEDFISAETVAQHLIRYLHNMGAHVVTVREPDLGSEMAIADDADAEVEGEARPGPAGWGPPGFPVSGDVNPFALGGSTELTAAVTETARVIWTFEVPADGDYELYVGYVQGPDRASDAHYIVRHAGGETHFRVDQRRHGSTWVRLGRFRFEAGRSERGAVVLANDSADAGKVVSADVVRIGGGAGLIDRGGGANPRPMFEHCARYYTQLAGAPTSVYDYSSSDDGPDDVGTRSRFAAWDHEDGEDAVYVAWHTNAPSPARGTSSFAYGPSSYGPLSEFSGVPGSLELMDAIHGELIADLRAAWDPDWQDRGQHTAYFGEVNPNHNPEMPATLIEVAFHDTAEDADALRDPRFRAIAARAMAQGVARYFAGRDQVALVLPPEPPVALAMAPAGESAIALRWRPAPEDPAGGDPATEYRVYLSRDGLAFDEGVAVEGDELTLEAPADGGALYARVTAVNEGGESMPSPVVGARVGAGGGAQVLIVDGFERLDRAMLIPDDLSAYDIGTIERGFIDRINDRSHVARHGAAVDAARVSFASATAGAVIAGDVDLLEHLAVDWFLGEESSGDDPLSAPERDAIAAYLAAGGRLLISGSELGWALDYLGEEEQRAFYRDLLHAVYVADDAETYSVTALDGPFAGLAPLTFDDHGAGSYDADYPDVLEPGPGGAAVLAYDGGIGGTAATWWSSDATGEMVLVMGFPFETIAGAEVRAEVMAAALAAFGAEADPVAIDPDDPDVEVEGSCGCAGSGPGPGAGGIALCLLVAMALLRRHRILRYNSRPHEHLRRRGHR